MVPGGMMRKGAREAWAEAKVLSWMSRYQKHSGPYPQRGQSPLHTIMETARPSLEKKVLINGSSQEV